MALFRILPIRWIQSKVMKIIILALYTRISTDTYIYTLLCRSAMAFKYISSSRTLSSSKNLHENQKRRSIALAEVGKRQWVGEIGKQSLTSRQSLSQVPLREAPGLPEA